MRICHVILSDRPYGAFNVVYYLAKAMSSTAEVTVAVNADLADHFRELSAVDVLALPLTLAKWPKGVGNAKLLRVARSSARKLDDHCRSTDAQILHFHLPNSFLVKIFSSRSMATVSTVHGPLYEAPFFAKIGSLISGSLFKGDSLVTVVNRDLEGYVRRQLRHAGPSVRLQFIPNGIDVAHVRRLAQGDMPDPLLGDAVRSARGSASPVLCFVGRLEERKGPQILLHAVLDLKVVWPNLLAIFVGDGPSMGSLEETAGRLGIGKNVVFLGFLENPYPIMRNSDIILTNLSSHLKGVSLVHLEALALGKPLLTRADEEKQAVLPGRVMYAKTDDPDELAELIREAWREPGGDLSTKSEVSLSFSWESVAAEYLRAYEEILAAKG